MCRLYVICFKPQKVIGLWGQWECTRFGRMYSSNLTKVIELHVIICQSIMPKTNISSKHTGIRPHDEPSAMCVHNNYNNLSIT